MNDSQHARMLQLLGEAIEQQPTLPAPHPIDNDEALACWSQGIMRPSERVEFTRHLRECHHCRQELTRILQAGVVEPPPEAAAEIATPTEMATVEPASETRADRSDHLRGSRPYHLRRWLSLAVAASLLLGMLGIYWWPAASDDPRLAQAEHSLRQGDALAAWNLVRETLTGDLSIQQREQAFTLMDRSGYLLALADLNLGDFEGVRERINDLQTIKPPSGDLAALQLQAQRGITAADSLAAKGALLDYGYETDGQSFSKSLTPLDAKAKQLIESYETFIQQHPDNPALRLNYAQLLLDYRLPEKAQAQLSRAQKLAPQSSAVYTGLGLAAFRQEQFEAALADFRLAQQLAPMDLNALINLATCLARLGKNREAEPLWRKALKQTDNEMLKLRISRQLEAGSRP